LRSSGAALAQYFGVALQQHRSPQQIIRALFADLAKLLPDTKFDFIWVASLFSHLSGPLFDAWLAKLSDSLSPRAVLCFSVHDE
jgi:alkanesulfonate monooxygenase SsuD/methylene tetrahydromethanopterin reductase-like flavin-dependent oxidoreductase (luciferase family)